ncbi:NAD(+) diphosphatase [Sandarakinorhabdus sp. AAP62]|uniref:NAD(+) diphosphatase n=1 Tax=Sandarakinorhabdus sp. AAP62 TaxID=1248916 RepID=UPI000301413E|nr:NAD(+) diphosphatase [Sandarakinorhabdus sp. AAP62]
MTMFHDVPVTGFSGNELDRADEIRRDPAALIAMRARPDARWLVLDGLNPVVRPGDNPTILWAYRSDVPHDALSIFLGVGPEGPRFAAAAPSDELISDFGGKLLDARAAGALLPAREAAIVAQARSILDWHQRHGFCAVCGGKTVLAKAGYARQCQACKAEHFPRVDPVVIMLAVRQGHALIGRQPRFPKGFLSALAGFVEPGESLEEAVRRELWEEAGIKTGRVRYLASQPWPFPSSLMIAAFAEAEGFEVRLDEDELEEVRWVTKDEVRAALAGTGDFLAPPPLAIAHTLLKSWVEE